MLPAEVLKALLDANFGDLDLWQHPLLLLDLCAAPGGKAIQLAEALEKNKKHRCCLLVANDPNPERAKRLRANLLRCGVENAMVSELSGEDFIHMPGVFDAVLVDAPCSAEANVRRDRRVLERWRMGKETAAYSRLLRRQQSLLQSAWTALKPGGYMLYSTCTLNYFENEGQCQKFASANPEARIVDLSFKDWGCSTSGKYLRLWPHSFGTEGFFVAAFQKRKSEKTEGRQQPKVPLFGHGKLPRFGDLFSKFRLLDWRLAARIRKQLTTEVGFWPHHQILVEDGKNLWLLPLATRLRWSKDALLHGNCDESEKSSFEPARLHSLIPHHLQRFVLSKLLPCLRVGRKTPNGQDYIAGDELVMLAGDRYKNFSQMTSDWAALELRICDSQAARNAHLSVLAKEGKTDEVYQAFNNMLEARLQSDGASYSALLTALVMASNLDRAQEMSQDVGDTILRRESFNKILHGFALKGNAEGVIRQIMGDMRERKLSPDVVSYNILLKALGRNKSRTSLSAELVESFLAEMRSCSVKPNHITFSSLMSLAADARLVEQLIHKAKSYGIKSSTFAFNILVQAYIKDSDLQSARAVVAQMKQEGLAPDVVTFTTMMQGQREDVVLDLMQDMRKNLVEPNSFSFTTLISTLAKAQEVHAALKISKDLQQDFKSKGQLSSHLACTILHICAKAAEQVVEPERSSLFVFATDTFQLVQQPDAACRNAFRAFVRKDSGKRV